MKIVFMGTPDFAVASLQALIDSPQHTVAGVFCQPDRPKGRGYKLAPPPVKELALAHNLAVFQPETLRDGKALDIFENLQPDAVVVVAYGKILPKELLDFPKYGCINLHGSLLPEYRGAGPVQRSIIDGKKETGVTTMFMAQGMDTGDILLTEKTPIGPEETAGELMDRLAQIGSGLLLQTLDQLEKGVVSPTKQDENLASYAPMLKKEDGLLDFKKPGEELFNQIRGVSPWPGAYAFLEGKRIKIHKVNYLPNASGIPGEIGTEETMIVFCQQGALEILELQPEGGKKMRAEDFLRGKGAFVGKKFTTHP